MNEGKRFQNGKGLNELALFAGAGGGLLGSLLLGHRPICAVEFDRYARSVLLARQDDGIFPPFPIWDDVKTFDGRPWRGITDVVSGGFPCQDISVGNPNGKGLDGERSGLWSEMARIIGEVRPRFVFVENSPMLVVRGLDRVLADLAEMGFNAEWGIMGADDVGAPHIRKRIWLLAEHPDPDRRGFEVERIEKHSGEQGKVRSLSDGLREARRGDGSNEISDSSGERMELGESREQGIDSQCKERLSERIDSREISDPMREGLEGLGNGQTELATCEEESEACGCSWWNFEPALDRVAHRIPYRVDSLKCIGNAQVPRVVEVAWKILIERLKERPG